MEPVHPFGDADVAAMRWVRSSPEKREFELRAGETLLGRLSFPHAGRSLATAELAGPSLTIKRTGFLQPRITVRSDGSTDLARLAVHGLTATVDVAGGGQYRLRRAGILVPAWQVADPSGRPLVHLEPVSERGRLDGGLLQVDPAIARSPDLPFLVLLAWYFVVLAWFEDEALRASEAVLSAASP